MKVNLTDVGVQTLKPPPRGQITVWDSKSPVGVRVSQGGSKTYVIFKGAGRRHTIARADALSLSEARIQAKRLIASRTLGIEPAARGRPDRCDLSGAEFIEAEYRAD